MKGKGRNPDFVWEFNGKMFRFNGRTWRDFVLHVGLKAVSGAKDWKKEMEEWLKVMEKEGKVVKQPIVMGSLDDFDRNRFMVEIPKVMED